MRRVKIPRRRKRPDKDFKPENKKAPCREDTEPKKRC